MTAFRSVARYAGISGWTRTSAFWMLVTTIALVLLFGVASRDNAFFTPGNLLAILNNALQIMLLAVGTTFVLAAGKIDLSIGPNVVLSSVIGAKVMTAIAEPSASGNDTQAAGIVIGLLAALLTGTVYGLANGAASRALSGNSLIATLGTGGIGLGIAFILTDGVNVSGVPDVLQVNFGIARIFGIVPVPALVVIPICLFLWYLLTRTRFGLHTLAIGASREAAIRAGLRVDRGTIRVFALSGFLCGLVAFLAVARFSTTNVGGHQSDALAAVAAAVMGGTSLFGGTASVPGSMVASLIPVVLGTGLVMIGIASFYQMITIGAFLLIAVFLDERRRR